MTLITCLTGLSPSRGVLSPGLQVVGPAGCGGSPGSVSVMGVTPGKPVKLQNMNLLFQATCFSLGTACLFVVLLRC